MSLESQNKAIQIYHEEFKVNPENAFKLMEDYLNSINIPIIYYLI